MARPQPLTLREPAALKALAHPVRQDLIALLDDNTVVTATAASERVGMSPSAVSHHLRLLEKYGIVERVEASEDARERPWRLRPGGLNLSPAAGDRSGQAAVMVLVRRQVDRQLERMERLLRADEEGEVEEADEGTLGFAFTRARLSRDEARELVHRIEVILEELRARRAEPSRSEDELEYSLAASVLPTDPEEFVRTVQRERSSPR
ncbi:ArsR family transcriptional regulator [Intrasporangium chromatireducens Q5-1]|uniref:ArsR family transcriptional regulator n=1 Tax=Intrasporangium chromatireducens Q5-1 TaxID=584657 RepID=W9GHQ9_9MICO|nr:winged helix-turn-helix domain-containing protein [Intrasporangium chromatireducens]EWT05766.1 ArsR family transcriptional regulator [Intrasporangium chromatireducens Q5-1]